VGYARGGGSTGIITPHGYQVCWSLDNILRRSYPEVDFAGVDKMEFHFELGNPFRPFEQLMGVLPEASKELVPSAYRVSAEHFFME